MQYSLYINQLFVANHPQCDELDIIDVAIFDCVRKMIAGNWGEKKLEGEVLWANIRVSKILKEMPMLRNGKGSAFKPRAIHGRISKLCNSGLLQKWEDNQITSSSFIALGYLAKEYDSYTQPLHLDANPIAPRCNGPLHEDAIYKNTLQNTFLNSIHPDSQANGMGEGKSGAKSKRTPTEKKRITFEQSVSFYADQLNALPEAEDSSPAAARAEGYAKMVAWMKAGDVEVPNGLRDTVMRMGTQLSFDQVSVLLDEVGLNWYQIKHYLLRLHNYSENKNTNVFLTIRNWHRMDVDKNAVPPRSAGTQGKSATGLSKPKEVHQ